jgi:CDP-diacylglycerol--glycerol-3-phosphate 3-phosphatidyltransferase
MVIIARELTVTITRMQATQQGVVIAANWWGKAKTIVQVAAIFCVIVAGHPTPALVDALVYGAVAITIVSGIDYFFGLRRVLREAEERQGAGAEEPASP